MDLDTGHKVGPGEDVCLGLLFQVAILPEPGNGIGNRLFEWPGMVIQVLGGVCMADQAVTFESLEGKPGVELFFVVDLGEGMDEGETQVSQPEGHGEARGPGVGVLGYTLTEINDCAPMTG